jgi:hypothetical protein
VKNILKINYKTIYSNQWLEITSTYFVFIIIRSPTNSRALFSHLFSEFARELTKKLTCKQNFLEMFARVFFDENKGYCLNLQAFIICFVCLGFWQKRHFELAGIHNYFLIFTKNPKIRV